MWDRAVPGLGGNNHAINCMVLNDTGSSLQTVHPEDLDAMGIGPSYMGFGPVEVLDTGNGEMLRWSIYLQVRLQYRDGRDFAKWIPECGIITPGVNARLSGTGIREELYFAIAPGNRDLYVADTKHGLMSMLPTLRLRNYCSLVHFG